MRIEVIIGCCFGYFYIDFYITLVLKVYSFTLFSLLDFPNVGK
jgi:uncharacterized oligopeptide transporter (OPT) family protein